MFRRADGIDVEQRRAAAVEAVDIAFDQMRRAGNGALRDEGGAVRHADQTDFLADFLLAMITLAVRRHVGDLADEAGCARLTAGIGIDLGIDHQNLHRHAGHQRARQVLEADVVHRAVAADGDHRRTQMPFFLVELFPVVVGELRVVFGRVVTTVQLQFCHANRLEAVSHLGHVAFEDAHRDRRRILEKMRCPRERIRVERVGGAPHRGAAGGIDDTHLGAAALGRAFDITPLEVFQARQQLRHPLQPLRIDRLRGMIRHQAFRQIGQGQIAALVCRHGAHHGAGIAQVDALGQLHAQVLFQPVNETGQLLDEGGDARLHQRGDRAGEDMDRGFLATAGAGAIAAGHRAVVFLVEQQGFQRADLLVETVDPAVFLRRGRQIEPEIPVLAQLRNAGFGLLDHLQCVVLADIDTQRAALAGVGIDGDREQSAGALGLLLFQIPVRLGGGELEFTDLLFEQVVFLFHRGVALVRVFVHGVLD